MTLLESIVCYSYRNTPNKSNSEGIRQSSVIIACVSVAMSLLAIFFLFMAIDPGFAKDFTRFLGKVFGRRSGKSIGILLAIILIGLSYPIINKMLGDMDNYNRIIQKYQELPELEQQGMATKGILPLIVSIILFFIFFFAYGIRIA